MKFHITTSFFLWAAISLPNTTYAGVQPKFSVVPQKLLKQIDYDRLPIYSSYLISLYAPPDTLLTTGLPIDSAAFPWLQNGTGLLTADTARVRPMLDSLLLIEPENEEDNTCLNLRSRYVYTPADRADLNTSTNGLTGLIPYEPENAKFYGLQTSGSSELGNAMMRLNYALYQANGEPVRLSSEYEDAWYQSSIASNGESKHRYWFKLDNAHWEDIKSGYLEIEMVIPDQYDYITLSADKIGQTFQIGGIAVKLLAFGPGYFHVAYSGLPERFFQQSHFAYFRDDQQLSTQLLDGDYLMKPLYDWFRNHPGLSIQEIEDQISKNDLPAETDEPFPIVQLYWTDSDADRIVLYCPKSDRVIASRTISFDSRPLSFNGDEKTYSFLHQVTGNKQADNSAAETIIPPTYKAGETALQRLLRSQVRYPQDASANGIQGTVLVTARIDKEGKIVDVSLTRGVDPLLDAEALRVVKLLEEWEPATVNGEKVEGSVLLPIIFRLQ